MTEKLGVIPVKDRVKEIGKFYKNAERIIKQELFQINIGNYSEVKAHAMRNQFDKFIHDMNVWTYKWAKKSVSEAYLLAHDKTEKAVLSFGKKKLGVVFLKLKYGVKFHRNVD